MLPEAQGQILREIAAHVRQRATVHEVWGFGAKGVRGLGISVLFAGASGTGKTLAAEVLAHELRLDLYRIDLSSVVSKYIGETEKNLRRVFDAAESGGVILLFDEADALFGKRSEVKDSRDRYANIEVSYLLQRMECYPGLAILMAAGRDIQFENQLPECLDAELRLADNLGVKPLKVGDAGFDEAINQGTIKWAVTTEVELIVIPKVVNGQEIPHTVLTRGKPVLAAGEAEIVGSNGQYLMLEISNRSGHFRPTSDSLEIGKEAFRQQGIDPTTAIDTII